jgi:hypothetical protein
MRRSVEVRTRWSKRVSVTARSHAETTVDWLLGLSWVSKALGKRSGHDDKVNESLSAYAQIAKLCNAGNTSKHHSRTHPASPPRRCLDARLSAHRIWKQ